MRVPKKVKVGFEIFLILFGIFMLIQVLRKILGGSWTSEDVILGFLFLNLGFTIGVVIVLAELKSDHNHLNRQFYALATDFKSHRQEFNHEVNEIKSKLIKIDNKLETISSS